MIERAFIDTNIFIYAFEQSKTGKKRRAVDLIKSKEISIVTSVQVLNEFVSAAVKKKLLSKQEAVDTALLIEGEFEAVPLDSPLFLKGMEIYRNKDIHISLWDSLIIAAAILSDCDTVYSEDMQHNQLIEKKLRIIDPFKIDS